MAEKSDVEASFNFAFADTLDAGRTEMNRLLKALPEDAYFCSEDVLAIALLRPFRITVFRSLGTQGSSA